MKRTFPRTKFVDTIFLSKQTEKIKEEMQEVMEQIDRGDHKGLTEELFDVIQSIETFMAILEERFVIDVDSLRKEVEEKNRARGYYGEVG